MSECEIREAFGVKWIITSWQACRGQSTSVHPRVLLTKNARW